MASHSFKVGDRVEHFNGGIGRVTEIKPDGAVCVTFERSGKKDWHGEYDAFWFRLHPNGLTIVS